MAYNYYQPYMQQPQYVPQQYQQPQQYIQPQNTGPRLVNSEDEIRPNEVPMDGTVSLFPTKDYSCIYAKKWGSDGRLMTFKFVPEEIKDESKPDPIIERLDRIEKMLRPYRNNNRKEVQHDKQS